MNFSFEPWAILGSTRFVAPPLFFHSRLELNIFSNDSTNTINSGNISGVISSCKRASAFFRVGFSFRVNLYCRERIIPLMASSLMNFRKFSSLNKPMFPVIPSFSFFFRSILNFSKLTVSSRVNNSTLARVELAVIVSMKTIRV